MKWLLARERRHRVEPVVVTGIPPGTAGSEWVAEFERRRKQNREIFRAATPK
jgi:hypothetical protein